MHITAENSEGKKFKTRRGKNSKQLHLITNLIDFNKLKFSREIEIIYKKFSMSISLNKIPFRILNFTKLLIFKIPNFQKFQILKFQISKNNYFQKFRIFETPIFQKSKFPKVQMLKIPVFFEIKSTISIFNSFIF